jgi:4-hydroxyphenylpyruvate dioxygenase
MATVCLAGTLEMKLEAIAAAGFDGVEIFEPDLVASPLSPDRVGKQCAELGLSIDLYQPMRDIEAVPAASFAANLRRAERTFTVMEQLGSTLVLVCSSVAPDVIDDDDLAAEQLHTLAERAAGHGIRIAYEALAWGTHVNTWDHSWEIVRRADHPALGICLDSFHILARGSATSGIRDIPADKLFFLQLSDAPTLDLGVLQWSRHHRQFPGQGAFDLVDFTATVLAAGYDGPLSLEVFNDTFRQAPPHPTAVDALRSLLVLQEGLVTGGALPPETSRRLACPPAAPATHGYAFCELGVDAQSIDRMRQVLSTLGFTATGRHHTQGVTLWQQSDIRLLVSTEDADPRVPGRGQVAGLGLRSQDPQAALARATQLRAPIAVHPEPLTADLPQLTAPDDTRVYFGDLTDSWTAAFIGTAASDPAAAFTGTAASDPVRANPHDPAATGGPGLTHIDHISMTQPFDSFDEAGLFYGPVLGLIPQDLVEYAAPFGLLRSRAMRSADGAVRIPLSTSLVRRGNWAPGLRGPQHVAFACEDLLDAAPRLVRAGVPVIDIPENYYADLERRFDLDPELLDRLRAGHLLYDRDAHGELLHLYTEVIGSRVFFEVLQRIGRYDGYGAANAPIHISAHHRLRNGSPT